MAVTKHAVAVLALAIGACGTEDDGEAGAETPDSGPECVHSSFDGLEPACHFAPGPSDGRTEPEADTLPKPTGTCPGFADGMGCLVGSAGALSCTFEPVGQPLRSVRVWLPPGEPTGPLVVYFYGMLGFPENAVSVLSGFDAEALALLHDAGGVLVAPQARDDRGPPTFSRLPWMNALGLENDTSDYELVDEIVACAIQELGIDARRIHVTGLSAGAWMTGQVAVHRSSYVASVALFSGGLENVDGLQDPDNKYPVALFHGGPSDFVGAHFENEAQSGANLWRSLGHFAMNCNHGGGHTVPAVAGQAGMRFMLDHPYGTVSSPYCDAAPAGFDFCALTTIADVGVVLEERRSTEEVDACLHLADLGAIDGGPFTSEMLACACERCGTVFEQCMNDTGCAANLVCASEHGCLGISCYQNALCAPQIDAAGGPLAESPQLAVALSDCIGAAACNTCVVPETR